jgi:hypothetical protein
LGSYQNHTKLFGNPSGRTFRMKNFPLTLVIIFGLFSMHCHSVFAVNEQSGGLIASQILTTLSVPSIQTTLAQFNLKPARPIQAVQLYKIRYSTIGLDGNTTEASAQVAIPLISGPLSLLCYHHGTVTVKTKAPSSLSYDSGLLHAAYFAGAGHLVVVQPDYLGLGENTLPIHPYLQGTTLASASTDAIIATKTFLKKLRVSMYDSIFLSGYSEGGFGTLSTLHYIETSHPQLKVRAAAPGAGPYLFNESIYFTLTEPGLSASLFAAYFLYSYHITHGFWPNLADVFQAPYDQIVPSLFDGTHDQEVIAGNLPAIPKDLLRPAFYDQLISYSEPTINHIVSMFNIKAWHPTTPIALIGAKADTDVPFFNAEILHDHWKSVGVNTTLINVGDTLGHYDGKFKTLEEQLFYLIKSSPV